MVVNRTRLVALLQQVRIDVNSQKGQDFLNAAPEELDEAIKNVQAALIEKAAPHEIEGIIDHIETWRTHILCLDKSSEHEARLADFDSRLKANVK